MKIILMQRRKIAPEFLDERKGVEAGGEGREKARGKRKAKGFIGKKAKQQGFRGGERSRSKQSLMMLWVACPKAISVCVGAAD